MAVLTTSLITPCSFSMKLLNQKTKSPISSLLVVFKRTVKSPLSWAIFLSEAITLFRLRQIELAIGTATAKSNKMVTLPKIIPTVDVDSTLPLTDSKALLNYLYFSL
jgi:hypothetical protein